MINLNDLENDPWPTYPAKKEDLRKLASALESCMRRIEELENVVCLGVEMREKQKAYFKRRFQDVLLDCKKAESAFDKAAWKATR